GKCIENCAYRTNFDIETNEQRRDREKAELAHMKEMNYCKWCKEFREDCKIERRKLADEETRKSEAEKCKPGAPTGTQYDVYDIIRNDIPTGNPAPDEFRSEDDDEAADRCYIPVEVRKANCPPPPPPPVIPPPPPNGGVERRCWCGSIGRHVDSADANDNTCTVVRPDTTLCSGAVRACNVSAGIVASFPKYICQQSSPLVNAQLVFDCCL
ncbi:MAG: hypothetical protein FWG80_04870, partial [Alphaproteobacteria bacterium]|nr:hypothetical protein [Alphaproteobacteria bacterium]